tara:strand:- start:536 stop:1039 length:504 start_codon:yes stop_codon:yes gene_type:complete
MGIEIERRFLVENDKWKSKVILSEELRQGYLNSEIKDWTVRVRIVNTNEGFLTLKSLIHDFINHEFEYPIPIQDAIELLNLSKYIISKTRYQLRDNGKNWIVDSFHNLNASLEIAEIELKSQSEKINVPSWCGIEITGNKSLSNACLAKTPISTLSLKDRLKDNKSS